VERDRPDHGTVSYLLTKPDVAISVAFFAHAAGIGNFDMFYGSVPQSFFEGLPEL
jgi:hypothetical protein